MTQLSVAERKGRLLIALFEVLKSTPEGLEAKVAIEGVRKKVELTSEEEGVFDQTGVEKFPQLVRFATIPAVKAGWMTKKDGTWAVTDAGLKALDEIPDAKAFSKAARDEYKKWKADAAVELEDDEVVQSEVSEAVSLEEAEDAAREEILDYLAKMLPFDFQKACAALVAALGHEVRWISPPGPDGGIDLLAYSDPIGARGRRIKGQAKRHKNKQDVDAVSAFLAKLKQDDVGLFIALGGFTKPAEDMVRADERRLILLDGPDFLGIWIESYEELTEDARNLLQLRPIWHLVRPIE